MHEGSTLCNRWATCNVHDSVQTGESIIHVLHRYTELSTSSYIPSSLKGVVELSHPEPGTGGMLKSDCSSLIPAGHLWRCQNDQEGHRRL